MKMKLIIALAAAFLAACAGLEWWSGGGFHQASVLVLNGLLFGGMPSGEDAEEAAGISYYVADHYAFTEKSKSAPGKSPVFCNAGGGGGLLGPRPHTLIVYSVTDKQQQDRILDLVRRYREQKRLRSVVVKFYRAENWTTRATSDGGELGFRGEEELLRSEKVR
jgi:hypothetical protein